MTWKKSSYSGQTGSCVEVGGSSGIVRVRDTKDRAGSTLTFGQHSWVAFLRAVKNQRFARAL
ncbi:DUF397 domain-containing protein [Saccharopolyspora indica]|nr:DUF397 domain-containing protein [Saccharopolyspora indica]MDA3648120.1 DUF397 domain-containing protein [Saccharopolyspora indica]